MRLKISLGWTMLWKGRVARFERRQGHALEWRVTGTNEALVFTDDEIADGIAKKLFKLHNPVETRLQQDGVPVEGAIVRKISDAENRATDREHRYVVAARQEGLTGASQAVKKDFLERMRAMAGPEERLLADVGVRTLERWVAKDAGAPQRKDHLPKHHRKGNRSDRLHEDVRDVVERRIDEHWMRRPRDDFETMMSFIRGDIDQLNSRRLPHDQHSYVGRNAVWTSIRRRKPSERVASDSGETAAMIATTGRRTLRDPDRPLDRLELDSTKVDLIVVDPETNLPIGRPWLVIATDRCTRMPAGFAVTFDPPSIHTVMECLRNAVFPKTYLQEMREKHDWIVRHDWPVYGKPRTLALDQGMENLSVSVRNICLDLGINEVAIMGRRKPWQKGGIERTIGTVSRKMFHVLPGTTFSNVLKRAGYNSAKDALVTMDELEHGLHKYLVDIYARTGHSGLSVGLEGRPIDAWEKLCDEDEVDFIPDVDEAHKLFGRSFIATLRPTGVPYKRLLFWSHELTDLLDDPLFREACPDRRLQCRMATGDIRQIHVELPHTGEILTVPIAEKWEVYATGLSIWQHERILDYRNERIAAGEEADDLDEMRRELSELMSGSSRRGRKSAHTVAQQRWAGAARQARAGRNTSTTIPGSEAARPRPGQLKPLDPTTPAPPSPASVAPASPYAGRTKSKIV